MKGSSLLLFAATVATLLAIVVGTTQAMQIRLGADAVETALKERSLVSPAWGCHAFCAWGPVNGFHRHTARTCRPVRC